MTLLVSLSILTANATLQLSEAGSVRVLSFDERVAAQRAIEEVYWRHRIWPEQNPQPKPPLSAVMSDEAIRAKVKDYLKKSNALDDWWKRPVTREQLQAELDRMSRQTRDPRLLVELYEALNDDPILIAETLARQVLVDRLVRNWYAFDDRFHGELRRSAEAAIATASDVSTLERMAGDFSKVTWVLDEGVNGLAETQVRDDQEIVLDPAAWATALASLHAAFEVETEPLPLGKPSRLQSNEDGFFVSVVSEQSERRLTIAIARWKKSAFEDWWRSTGAARLGVEVELPSLEYALLGPASNPCDLDAWTPTAIEIPDPRVYHTAVWTGSEMIVWGGHNLAGSSYTYHDSGGRYDPATDTWILTSTGPGTPSPRARHTAIWTGTEMIVWGGVTSSSTVTNTGGRYDPSSNSWSPVSTGANAPGARHFHSAVWTGSQMIIWGGATTGFSAFANGARYDPASDSWSTLATSAGAPSARFGHTAVWTDTEMVIWGGVIGTVTLNTGARYDPTNNSWIATSIGADVPAARWLHTAVWSESEMIVWGGQESTLPSNFLASGARYDPNLDAWTPVTATSAPTPRSQHTSVWTGSVMIVWGGSGGSTGVNTGARYNPTLNQWTPTSIAGAPTGRESHVSVWTGSEMITWGGRFFASSDGGRYSPGSDSWVAVTEGVAVPTARFLHTAQWTGTEMIVWGGLRDTIFASEGRTNRGALYVPSTDSWTPTSIGAGVPSPRYRHTAVWSGIEMIVWGGVASSEVNTGGRFTPSTNSWTPVATGGSAPTARRMHSAVWTGTEMVVWGGWSAASGYFQTGGRYSPGSNSWAATSVGANLPLSRGEHTAVWTESEMIIWGGRDASTYLNSGGSYSPSSDEWSAIGSGPNLPTGRAAHTAVWTGSEMIVWGGEIASSTRTNTGGRYHAATGEWEPTSIAAGVPTARRDHAAVWTASEMMVWGGSSAGYLATGGRYLPLDDRWDSTPTIGAPSPRQWHTAIWTGSEMIVWGGAPQTSTGALLCASPPFVVDVDPLHQALGISRATNVTVKFSEPVDPSTLDLANFHLLDPLGNMVAVTGPTLDPEGQKATLDPIGPLLSNTLYTVEVASAVTDLFGFHLADSFTSRFRTAPPSIGDTQPLPDVSQPTPQPQNAGSAAVGRSVAGLGDLDEDGLPDLVAGAPGYDPGSAADSGAALVYFGSTDLAADAAADLIFVGAAAGDRAGISVAGDIDFNGDGHRDILIGADQAATGSGQAYLIYFDPTNLTLYPNIANPAVPDILSLADVGTTIPGVVFTGATMGDRAGFSVAAGGLLDPGATPDILIGAPGVDATELGTLTEAGAAYGVFNAALSGTISLADVACTHRSVAPCAPAQEVAGIIYEGDMVGMEAGFSVTFAGGIADEAPLGTVWNAVVGAPGASIGGPLSGLVMLAEAEDEDSSIIGVCAHAATEPGALIIGAQAGMRLGSSIADGGDMLADGVPDLLIGAPTYDAGSFPDAGQVVHVTDHLTRAAHVSSDVGISIDGVLWNGIEAGAQLGFAVAGIGDVSGDGYDDIAMGAPFADPDTGQALGAVTDAGAIYVAHGLPAPLVTAATIEVGDIGTEVPGQILVGTEIGENAGSALAGIGDLNGDGNLDFAVGASGLDGMVEPNVGTVYIVVESTPPLPGACLPGVGCVVADLANGAQLSVPAGALAAPTTLAITGVLDAASLPAPPFGRLRLGRSDLTSGGQILLSPAALHLPTRLDLQSQLTGGESLSIYRCSANPCMSGSSWIDTGTTGTVVANLYYPGQLVVSTSVSELRVYAVFLPDTDGDSIRNELDNCPTVANPTQINADGDGLGDACDTCTDTDGDGFGNPGYAANTCPLDNCPAVSNPTQADTDADGLADACDNCPAIANASQTDGDNDTIGDACDTNPTFIVSNDPSDDPDFSTVQDAVDAVTQSGTRIRVLPGVGPYLEDVVVNESLQILFEGYDPPGPFGPTSVIVDGGSMPAFSLLSTSGSSPIRMEDLTLKGASGIESSVGTELVGMKFESVSGTALVIAGGTHRLADVVFDASVADAISVATGASLELRQSRIEGISGTAVAASGAALLENVLIAGANQGVVLGTTGNVTLRHVTLVGSTGAGVDRTAGGTVVISHSILWGNVGGDLVNTPCPSVSWSDVGGVDCTAVNDNLQGDPLFVDPGDWRLQPGSPAIDHGPAASSFTGVPCFDLEGRPRQLDFDGDGLAVRDIGAYEHRNASLVPGPVADARWATNTRLTWNPEPAAVEYHVYRGALSTLGYGSFGACRDDLDPNRTDEQIDDLEIPSAGAAYFYLITAESGAGDEGSAGETTCTERSAFSACP